MWRTGRLRSPRRAGLGKLVIGLAATMAMAITLSGAVAISPQLLGQYFTLFEEVFPDGSLRYRVEARVIGVTPTGLKTADVDVQVRVTNNNPYGVEVILARFEVVDLRERRTTLLFVLEDVFIPAGTVKGDILTTAKVIKVLGVGNRYLVLGSLTWKNHHPTVITGPFVRFFEEEHTVMEFIH